MIALGIHRVYKANEYRIYRSICVMTVLIKNRETDALIRHLAKLKGVGLTEAVHEALENELKRQHEGLSLVERSRAFTQRLMERARPDLGKPADKEFIDWLYEDD